MSEAASPFAEYLPSPAERVAGAEVRVAEAVAADLEEIAALQVGVRGGTVSEWSGRIGRTMDRALSAVAVARVGAEIAGYGNVMYLAPHPADEAPGGHYLMGVSVAHRWRRRGIGDAVTRWRMAWVWERASEVWCFVSAANPASVDLHLALGFAEVRRAPALQGVTFDCGEGVLMRAARRR
jgi:ribosomal protein S18 acetylase RimI-like enzyme